MNLPWQKAVNAGKTACICNCASIFVVMKNIWVKRHGTLTLSAGRVKWSVAFLLCCTLMQLIIHLWFTWDTSFWPSNINKMGYCTFLVLAYYEIETTIMPWIRKKHHSSYSFRRWMMMWQSDGVASSTWWTGSPNNNLPFALLSSFLRWE